MKKQAYAVSMLSAALFLAACDGKDGLNGTDGVDGADGADGFNSLVAFRDIPKGDAVCLGGGRAVDSGLDTNRNNVLDPEEVTATEIVECAATPTVRALHASPDAPAVNIWVNGAPALTNVDYTVGSGFLPVVEENLVQVEAIIPFVDAIEDRIVIEETVALDYSTETTIIAIDNVAPQFEGDDTLRALPITNSSDERITQGNFRAQIVHAAPSAPPVDVYLTALDADLAGAAPVTGVDTPLAFENFTPRIEAPAGAYQVRITLAGDSDTVVFDSGAEIPLPAGADLMIVAVENTGPGSSPVKLVVLDGAGSDTLLDANTTASVVAVHLSPDAPAVDLLADVNSTPEVEAIPLVRNVAYGDFCDIDSVPAPGEYIINVALNSDNSTVAYSFDPLQFEQGDEALAIVSGFATPDKPPAITDITLPGNTRSVATEARLRITHASPSTPNVDLYLVPDGTLIADEDPTVPNVPFGASTDQFFVDTSLVYDVYVTAAGSKDPAIEVQNAEFSGGEVIDVIARDPVGEEMGPQLTVLDYVNAEDENFVAACPAP